MADKIILFHGLKAEMPELLPNEPGFCTDTFELYVGSTEQGNKLVGAFVWGEDINTLYTSLKSLEKTLTELKDTVGGKLTATKAASVGAVAENATTADIITAFNSLIGSLKTAGIMNT